MNRWRILGLVVLALLAASLLAWWLKPAPPPPPPPQPPAREVFHSSKPLRIEVASARPAAETAWLDYELRHLLNRGRMRVAAIDDVANAFTLRVSLDSDADGATLALVAPDGVVEREEQLQLPHESRLATLGALAERLPQFLGAQAGSANWVTLIGTDDANAYDAYLADALELLGPDGQGLTRPGPPQNARIVERLETLARHQPRFARARAALAIAYLSLGGQDQSSLAQLAKTSAERALAADDEIAEAHAALGLVHMRRGDWTAAREQFDRALALDANSAAALEGSGCLLVDAGRYAAARPLIEHAVQLQPRNVGARECLAYLDAGAGKVVADDDKPPSAVARVQALAAILASDVETARQVLRAASSDEDFREWAEPLAAGRVGSRPHSGCAAVGNARGERRTHRRDDRDSLRSGPAPRRVRLQSHGAPAARARAGSACACCGCRRRHSCGATPASSRSSAPRACRRSGRNTGRRMRAGGAQDLRLQDAADSAKRRQSASREPPAVAG